MTELQKLNLAQLKDKKIVVLGAGLTGLSCVRFLHAHAIYCSVIDSRPNVIEVAEFEQSYPKCKLVLGIWDQKIISGADLLIVSPGIDMSKPEISSCITKQCLVIGDIELYCQLSETPILAVTGSNGKSTVVSLLHYLGNALGFNVQLGGNIGKPVLENIEQKIDCLVLELSSFQLETLKSMKAIAGTVLNVSDDHLDRHKTFENYRAIKQRIYEQCQVAIINRDDQATQVIKSHNNIISFGSDAPMDGDFGLEMFNGVTHLMFGKIKLIEANKLPIAGMHNALNCLAALALGHSAGWPVDEMAGLLSGFRGLAHRCQRVPSDDDIVWINDSKATNVGATLAAIKGLSETISKGSRLILIAGGDGKGADFTPLSSVITQHIEHLFTLGKDGNKIAKLSDKSITVSTLEDAVLAAKKLARSGDTVLLSPACASIDMFKNFEERGQTFINAVQCGVGGCNDRT